MNQFILLGVFRDTIIGPIGLAMFGVAVFFAALVAGVMLLIRKSDKNSMETPHVKGIIGTVLLMFVLIRLTEGWMSSDFKVIAIPCLIGLLSDTLAYLTLKFKDRVISIVKVRIKNFGGKDGQDVEITQTTTTTTVTPPVATDQVPTEQPKTD